MNSILQTWVQSLGLRHQGCLLTAIRGCDTAPKDDPAKAFIRCYRGTILNAHCGDPNKAQTFIQAAEPHFLWSHFKLLRRSHDHYPHHYVMHLTHAIQIVGYKHPNTHTRKLWTSFYHEMCDAMHVNPETEAQMDERLNADEDTFAARDHTCDGTPHKPCLTGGTTVLMQGELKFVNDLHPET